MQNVLYKLWYGCLGEDGWGEDNPGGEGRHGGLQEGPAVAETSHQLPSALLLRVCPPHNPGAQRDVGRGGFHCVDY